MDAVGASALTGFSIVLAYNQVVIKVVNGGIQPVFSAGLRSVAAFFVLSAVFLVMRYRIKIPRSARAGLAEDQASKVAFQAAYSARWASRLESK